MIDSALGLTSWYAWHFSVGVKVGNYIIKSSLSPLFYVPIIIIALSARYGLSDNFETYVRTDYLNSNNRVTDLSGSSSMHKWGQATFIIVFSYFLVFL